MSSTFHVIVCAALLNENDEVFVARRRPEKKLGGFWEFPGGKLEPGEELIPALKRELREELNIEAHQCELLHIKPHQYDHGNVLILFYTAKVESGDLKLVDHDEYKWLTADKLETLQLLPANQEAIEKLIKHCHCEC